MKNIAFILTLLLIGCTQTPIVDLGQPKQVVFNDTIYDTVYVYADNIQLLNEYKSAAAYWQDSVHVLNSTITLDDYENARKMEKIRYYISITERNPKNKTFFFGWIKRTMTD